MREALIESGDLRLAAEGQNYLFTKDTEFSSVSAASATILGRPDNGRLSWRISGTPITYAAWLKSRGETPADDEGDGVGNPPA